MPTAELSTPIGSSDDEKGSAATGHSTPGMGDGRLRFEAFVNNLTEEVHEAAIIITQFDNTRFFTRPRTFGARVPYQF